MVLEFYSNTASGKELTHSLPKQINNYRQFWILEGTPLIIDSSKYYKVIKSFIQQIFVLLYQHVLFSTSSTFSFSPAFWTNSSSTRQPFCDFIETVNEAYG